MVRDNPSSFGPYAQQLSYCVTYIYTYIIICVCPSHLFFFRVYNIATKGPSIRVLQFVHELIYSQGPKLIDLQIRVLQFAHELIYSQGQKMINLCLHNVFQFPRGSSRSMPFQLWSLMDMVCICIEYQSLLWSRLVFGGTINLCLSNVYAHLEDWSCAFDSHDLNSYQDPSLL